MCIIEADKFSKTVKVNVKMYTIITEKLKIIICKKVYNNNRKLKMRICKNKYNNNRKIKNENL